jgi:hypothetical protein
MNKKAYIWIAVAILGVGGYYAYKLYKKPVELTKEESVNLIVEKGKSTSKETLLTFEEGYLKAWANAILQNKDAFVYNAKTYNTQGGKSVK